ERGFAPETSTVTAFDGAAPANIIDKSKTAHEMLETIARAIAVSGSNNMFMSQEALLVLGPEHASTAARPGFDKTCVRPPAAGHRAALPRGRQADSRRRGAGEVSGGPVTGSRVVELADEQAEYCGLTLAGLGADVVKVEPPGGNPTRRIGPFYQDREDPERSLFFWQYNRGKRSIVLDLRQVADRDRFSSLVATAD